MAVWALRRLVFFVFLVGVKAGFVLVGNKTILGVNKAKHPKFLFY